MKKILFLLCWLCLSLQSFAEKGPQHAALCLELGGELKSQFTCPSSGVERQGDFCVVPGEPGGNEVFFNGCTQSVFGYGKVFYASCVKHDLCYHHEPSTHGKSRKQCDQEFRQDMKDICAANKGDSVRCRKMVSLFYKSVRLLGKKSWKCSNTVFTNRDFDMDPFGTFRPILTNESQ